MSYEINDLIAEARKFDTVPADYAIRLKGAHGLIDRLADALESLSAPSGEDAEQFPESQHVAAKHWAELVKARRRIAELEAAPVAATHEELLALWGSMPVEDRQELSEAIDAFRRPSPVTREALEVEIYEAEARYDDMQSVGKPPGSVVPSFERFLADALVTWLSLPESAENPVVSAIEAAKAEVAAGRRASVVIDVPDPVTREALAVVADAIRQSCTPSFAAYQSGGDALIAAVADWVENPPDWVTALRFLPEPAEVEWEYTLMQGDTTDEIFDSMSDLADYYGIRFHEGEYPVRRVKAGPWVPVKGTEQS